MARWRNRLLKLGYGYDTSGEVQEGSGSQGNQKNVEESNGSQPQDAHRGPFNGANAYSDSEAVEEFPELLRPSKITHLPSRGIK